MKNGKTTMAARSLAWVCACIVGLSLAYGGADGKILQATPEHHDFGTIAEGVDAVVTVSIQNVGTAPVEITNVRTS